MSNKKQTVNSGEDEEIVYCLLSKISELLILFKNYDLSFDPRDYIFSTVALFCINIPHSIDKTLDSCVAQAKKNVKIDRTYALAYYMGTALCNIRKGVHKFNLIQELVNQAQQFNSRGQLNETIDALFYATLITDILRSKIDATIISSEILKIAQNLIMECISSWDNLRNEYKIKVLYSLSVVNDRELRYFIGKVKKEIPQIIDAYNGEFIAFLLKPLVVARCGHKHKILTKLEAIFKRIGKGEKELLEELFRAILSGKETEKIAIEKRNHEKLKLSIELSASDLAGIVHRNIQQISMIGIGLWVAGYHRSYILPCAERQDYIKYIQYEIKKDPDLIIVSKSATEEICRVNAEKAFWISMGKSILFLFLSVMIAFLIYLNTQVHPAYPIIAVIVLLFIEHIIQNRRHRDSFLNLIRFRKRIKEKIKEECIKQLMVRDNG